MKRNRYIRDIYYKIVGIYYKGHIFQTNPNYYGLSIDGTQVLSEKDFDLYCSDSVARNRLLKLAKVYTETLEK